jgi:hypothetical protein
MALLENEIGITTGERESDGRVRVYLFSEDKVALTVDGRAERTPTLLLTLKQARKLQNALGELIPKGDGASSEDEAKRK